MSQLTGAKRPRHEGRLAAASVSNANSNSAAAAVAAATPDLTFSSPAIALAAAHTNPSAMQYSGLPHATQIAHLASQIKQLQEERDELQIKRQFWRNETTSQRQYALDLKAARERDRQVNADLREQLNEAITRAEASDAAVSRVNEVAEKLQPLMSQITTLQSELTEVRIARTLAESSSQLMQRNIASMTERNRANEAELQTQHTENARLQQHLQAAGSEVNSLRETLQKLKQQLQHQQQQQQQQSQFSQQLPLPPPPRLSSSFSSSLHLPSIPPRLLSPSAPAAASTLHLQTELAELTSKYTSFKNDWNDLISRHESLKSDVRTLSTSLDESRAATRTAVAQLDQQVREHARDTQERESQEEARRRHDHAEFEHAQAQSAAQVRALTQTVRRLELELDTATQKARSSVRALELAKSQALQIDFLRDEIQKLEQRRQTEQASLKQQTAQLLKMSQRDSFSDDAYTEDFSRTMNAKREPLQDEPAQDREDGEVEY